MRVLVATTAGAGHFAALAPFAAALRDAGHAVRVAAPASFALVLQKEDFDHVPLADPPLDELGAVFARLPGLSMEEANALIVREVYGRIDASAGLPDMQAAVDQWRPHVILRETAEFASYVVAERSGIPHVHVAIGLASVEAFMLSLIDEPLRAFGLEQGGAGLAAAPRLTLVPASLEEQVEAEPGPTHRFRHATVPTSEPGLPRDWWPDSSPPLVYMSFGSVAASMGFFPDFYRAMLTALADLPVRVLLTLGQAGDPELLGPLPPHIHVERWWPQEQVMPLAAAMVTHGGFGTTLLGLSTGLPMVVVPLFAVDQYANARRIQAIGAGVALEEGPAAPARVSSALEEVLNNGGYRIAARRVADEIAELPPASECVAILDALVKHQPQTTLDRDT